jgi:hypothetical protein
MIRRDARDAAAEQVSHDAQPDEPGPAGDEEFHAREV